MKSLPKDNRLELLIPIFLGLITFFTICNYHILDVTNISWFKDDDQWDIYIGALFFQQSPWSNPIGLNPNFGIYIAAPVVFTAGGLALFPKLLNNLFPPGFQLIGYWYLLCFVLQATISWKILSKVTLDISIRAVGVMLIMFSPPMLFRVNLHPILVGHFFILGSIYLAFWRKSSLKTNLLWLLLLTFSLMAQIYFFAMVWVIWIAAMINSVFVDRSLKLSAFLLILLAYSLFILALCWQLGFFLISGPSSGHFGFGFFRAHLLTFFDSDGWSYLLPKIQTSKRQFGDFKLDEGLYEGFAYLGGGALLLLATSIFQFAKKPGAPIFKVFSLKNNIFPILAIIFLFIFSLSNNLTVLHANIFIPIPNKIFDLASILRSSGRAVWPIYYGFLIALIFLTVKIFRKRIAIFVLLVCIKSGPKSLPRNSPTTTIFGLRLG